MYRGWGRLTPVKDVEVLAGAGGKESETLESRHILVASGGHPRTLKGVEIDGNRVLSSRHAMTLENCPASIAIVGSGPIGVEFAYFFNAFGVRVTLLEAEAQILPREDEEIGALLRESDVMTLHAPATPDTRGIIDAAALAHMKPGAILINTARGDLVREEALATALERGHLGAAGLDVYQDEPDVSPRLRAAPRAVLLPHLGSATMDTRRRMAEIAVANVQAVLGGRSPLTPVYR